MPQVAPAVVPVPPPPAPQPDSHTVHLTAQRDGSWHVTVTRAGRAGAFVAEHRDAARALAMAQQIAAVEEADLLVRTTAGAGAAEDWVPAARVAGYGFVRADRGAGNVLPARPPRG